ncbi:MAG: signal peptidase I [Ilumatobacteraceae bacterium]
MSNELTDPGLEAEPAEPRPSSSGGPLRAAWEWLVVIVVALGVAILIRSFAIAPFFIPSDSMFDTLATDDRILVNKLSYRLHDVNRGDVIVFEKPAGVNFGSDDVEDLIKRVIGLPGDELSFRDCSVYVNGSRLVEPYTDDQCTEPPGNEVDPDQDGSVTVPENSYFVMGDNRRSGQSFDSRYWGYVDDDLIVGRAFIVIWPRGHWRWL